MINNHQQLMKESFFSMDIIDQGSYVRISNFPIKEFKRDVRRFYKTNKISNVVDTIYMVFGTGSILIHKFFLPELLFILDQIGEKIPYNIISNLVLEKTWMKNTLTKYNNRFDMSKVSRDLSYILKPYQKEFIEQYDDIKQKYYLNGYILAFEQGLGKTFTSLALMHGLNKEAVIIVAPRQTLTEVWKKEIENVFKSKQDIWIIGDPPKESKFYIINYESLEKINTVYKFIKGKKRIGIIVDEIHNFRNMDTKRVTRLVSIAKHLNCNDLLLMSGTPIKALGREMIPILTLLDPLFDKEAAEIFKKIFGLNVMTALDILKNRLGLIMHRKLKSEVLNLLDKQRFEVKIKIPNSDKYTLEKVKRQVVDYIWEREKYYKKNYNKYEDEYNEAIDYVREKLKNTDDFNRYLEIIETLKSKGYNRSNTEIVKDVAWLNKYEKEIIRPLLTPELKKKFDSSKAVVKYVNLKIMGEVIGGLLNQLRSEMFSQMINHSPLCKIINSSEKKTICFSTYVDVVKSTEDYTRKQCKKNPAVMYGETSSNIVSILNDFKTNEETNPLIATIQTLSTGVTLVEADIVVFINEPWRSVDKDQAEDRVHRIGQTSIVKVYTFILDTGESPNLSTRMSDIVKWSKEMFEGIVGKDEVQKFERTTQLFSRLLK